ncbi:Cold-shock DNA-binding domain-containing protein [Ditylenchus destructor]|nr:Cold-shock DNA-binding domain-containing protein [Ditylenchus destructor]
MHISDWNVSTVDPKPDFGNTGRPAGGHSGSSGASDPKVAKEESGHEESREERQPPKVPTAEDMERYKAYVGQKWSGVCKWFNVSKGFGFVVPDHDEAKEHDDDVFVHQSALQMPGFRSLGEGEAIQFTVRVGKRGLEAEDVTGIAGAEIKGHTIRPLGRKKENLIREKVCYNCHSKDHLLADCPTHIKGMKSLSLKDQKKEASRPAQQPTSSTKTQK